MYIIVHHVHEHVRFDSCCGRLYPSTSDPEIPLSSLPTGQQARLVRSPMNPGPPLRLANGVPIPTVGLGVFRAAPADTRAAVRAAIQAGYRHVDTAQAYGNEAAVGAAIRESGVPRDEIFVTTKLWNSDQGEERALQAFEQSRLRLGLEQVDLYLLHWPVPKLRTGSWRALERLLRVRGRGPLGGGSRRRQAVPGVGGARSGAPVRTR